MKLEKFAVSAALVATALGVSAGTVNAAPAATDAGVVNYTATNSDRDVVIRTDAGSLVVDNGVLKIKAADGTVVAGTELSFRVDDYVFPIAADIHDRVATLTPQFDAAHAVYQPVALPLENVAMPFENSAPWKSDYDREQAAWSRMTSTLSMGATIGTLAGGLGGAALGCLIGAVGAAGLVTLGSAGILAAMFVPLLGAAGTGCLIGAAAVGFLGTIAGQLFVTAPVAIAAAVQYFTTISQPSITPAK
ncbi:hypothetical protein [Nocardia seriolae]|uniref:DUF8020 domain-containing protein n=1 Tax=Nocardia seriolae TaxID=37332 RepID=A0A0B8NMZ3_9NOCA|nr:hypothetical protein [Nocardia seriolae]APA96580.1 hypothetical protein NS506_02516 [Nocardia seriolae]MTJ61646.1 hypothetical protein [Nocardia seriolae]MTJ75169.1 hypothetical protein [Nocardia seriolae]MTJ86664.1 hypothetical protein [Nocardia seriolae]MTK30659.1 hypothetical protein [Nocardia seriolae]